MMKSIEMIFGENLRRARRARGLTQRELAERLQYSEKSVSKWESGENPPRRRLLPVIAQALNCTVAELTAERQVSA